MINILFVDDEPNILDGLKRTLRPLRYEWQASFANSGAEALKLLTASRIDVVVTDMRMPGMDGARLLQEVRTRYPHIVRVILSGHSEKDLIMKAVGTAHQYLAKPCEADALKATVERACALRDLLTDEKLRSLISQLHTVPSLPTLYTELLSELQSPDPSLKKVGKIISQDIGMTVKILQIVNSAFFGVKRNLVDADEAVSFIGLDIITALVLTVGVFSQFDSQSQAGKVIAQVWQHSNAVGAIAKTIAAQEGREAIADAFTAGLLHDIGKLLLAFNLPDQFAAVHDLVIQENISWIAAEKHIFAASHAEMGAYLLGLWGLPSAVVEAVAFHHNPSEYATNSFTALTALHVADALHYLQHSPEERAQPSFDSVYLGRLGLLDKAPLWQQSCAYFAAIAATHA